ncbi:KpsF/GutQ family sugar-phosphate isomerase [Candidatus Proelusimicrobium excrementi]|uniref:KpsF/GutQ family sugar-phosphate isomerase n=2 Tax=Candidatus Proelusimicrobium excrementi TaxID=3416222 RepID=UPI003D0F2246
MAEMKQYTDEEIISIAKEVFKTEEHALKTTGAAVDGQFVQAVRTIAACKGRLVLIGIGKSGHIGRKIAATLASTGTPSFFVHPTEALHGDLGMITNQDLVLALSFSGQTEEISKILMPLKKEKVKIISMTGNPKSNLALMSDLHIGVVVEREACPYNLAPTASTTAMLACGDALAIALMKIKHFEKKDFALFHPGGSLGKLLTYTVKDIMFTGKNPTVPLNATVQDTLLVMTKNKSGAASVVDGEGRLKGYFTDGDLRRALQKQQDILKLKITEVMTHSPFAFQPETPAVEAAKIINDKKIDNAPVTDGEGKVIGFLDKDNLIEFIALTDKK